MKTNRSDVIAFACNCFRHQHGANVTKMSIGDTLQSFIAHIRRHEIRSGATDDALECFTTESWITTKIDARNAGREVRAQRIHPHFSERIVAQV
jgi:hypothetical protein